MIALKDCADVRATDLVAVSLPYRVGMDEPNIDELDDGTLLKFIEPIFALPQWAASQPSGVRLHYEERQDPAELRADLERLDPRTISDLSIARTLDSMEVHFPIVSTRNMEDKLRVEFTFDKGRVTDLDVSAVVFIY